jgi:hypothetical protein
MKAERLEMGGDEKEWRKQETIQFFPPWTPTLVGERFGSTRACKVAVVRRFCRGLNEAKPHSRNASTYFLVVNNK